VVKNRDQDLGSKRKGRGGNRRRDWGDSGQRRGDIEGDQSNEKRGERPENRHRNREEWYQAYWGGGGIKRAGKGEFSRREHLRTRGRGSAHRLGGVRGV